jgi:hypothetical protein
MVKNDKLKYERPGEDIEESQISKTLEFLAEKGIDGIRIKTPSIYGACFLPILMTEEAEYFIRDIVSRCGGKYRTDDLMEIDVFNLLGMNIKNKYNPKFKNIEASEPYTVLRIRDSELSPRILFKEGELIL